VSIDVDIIQKLIIPPIVFVARRKHSNLIARLLESAGLLPNAGVKGNRKVFNDD
jgi:hypothetical protein